MICDSVSKLIPLYPYGELTPEEEDRLEQHLHECAGCTQKMDAQTALAAALDRRRLDVPPMLLEDCREDLMAAIEGGAGVIDNPAKGPWTLFLEAIGATFGGLGKIQRPVGAMALIAVGFFAARISGPGLQLASNTSNAGLIPADAFSTVRSIQRDTGGGVQISFDETRRRVISGNMEDQAIQKLLLAAVQEENPAVRMESVGLLTRRPSGGAEIRDALLNSLAHDTNVGVRLKALDGLKQLAGDPVVRKTLAQVLLADDNPSVRMQVVDVLMSHRDDAVVGVLQGMVQREDNNSVRLKMEKALKEMNASIGTF